MFKTYNTNSSQNTKRRLLIAGGIVFTFVLASVLSLGIGVFVDKHIGENTPSVHALDFGGTEFPFTLTQSSNTLTFTTNAAEWTQGGTSAYANYHFPWGSDYDYQPQGITSSQYVWGDTYCTIKASESASATKATIKNYSSTPVYVGGNNTRYKVHRDNTKPYSDWSFQSRITPITITTTELATTKTVAGEIIQVKAPLKTDTTYYINLSCTLRFYGSTSLTTNTDTTPIDAVTTFTTTLPKSLDITWTTPAPPTDDPPFHSVQSNTKLYIPGPVVTYTVPTYNATTYYDQYEILVNPSQVVANQFSGSEGIIAISKSGTPTCNSSVDDLLNKTISVTAGTTFKLRGCHMSIQMKNFGDLRDSVVHQTQIFFRNVSHDRIAATIPINLYANDLTLSTPLSTIRPNQTTHGDGTSGLLWPLNWKYAPNSITTDEYQIIQWVLNDDSGNDQNSSTGAITGHAAFAETDCSSDANHDYPETEYVQTITTFPTIYMCGDGVTYISAYYGDPTYYRLLRQWKINIGSTLDNATQTNYTGTDAGVTDLPIKSQQRPPLPSPTSPADVQIQVEPTPTPAPTATPFIALSAFTPTPNPPVQEAGLTDERTFIHAVISTNRHSDGRHDIEVRYNAILGSSRYEILYTEPSANGQTTVTRHVPVNDPIKLTYKHTTLTDKGNLTYQVRGAYDCPITGNTVNGGPCLRTIVGGPDRDATTINQGTTAYSPWSPKKNQRIETLTTPSSELVELAPTQLDAGRHSVNLSEETGGLVTQLFGTPGNEARNWGITIWAIICLAIASAIYMKIRTDTKDVSGLVPWAAAVAVISLIFTWTILGYIFWDLKIGTAAIPVALLLFTFIQKGWQLVTEKR